MDLADLAAADELRLDRDLAAIMSLSASLADAAEPLMHAIGTAIGAEAGALWLPADGAALACASRWVAPRLHVLRDQLAAAGGPPSALVCDIARATRGAAAFGPASFGTLDDVPAGLAAAGLREVVAVALRRERRTVGVLELFAERCDGRDGVRARLVESLAGLGQRIAECAERFGLQRMLSDIFEQAPDALFIVAADGRIRMANAHAATLTAVPRDALVGLLVEDLVPAAARRAQELQRQRFWSDAGGRRMGSGTIVTIQRADGVIVPVDLGVAPIVTPDGRAMLVAARPLRAPRVAPASGEPARATSERADTLDALVGAVDRLVRDSESRAAGVDAAAARDHNGKARVDLNALVRTTLAVSRHEWSPVAQVAAELADGLPLVELDEAGVTHALFELVLNAAQAIAAKRGRDPRAGLIVLRTRCRDPWIEVEIEDNGSGMTPFVRSHIFEPFFSTKPHKSGRGQGLLLVKTTVDAHRGELAWDTRDGHGTTFRVRLPLASVAAPGA